MTTVCYFGAYDPESPRNRILRRGLALNGVQVIECRVSPRLRTWQRYLALLRQHQTVGTYDVMVVAEFCPGLVPLARLLTWLRRRPLVYDPAMPLYEVSVEVGSVPERSRRAQYYYWLDRQALTLPDLTVVAETPQVADHWSQFFHVSRDKLQVVPLGADDEIYYPRPPTGKNGFKVFYVGGFWLQHGVEFIIQAAKLLEGYPDIIFELVGSGPMFNSVRQLIAELGLTRVHLLGRLPPDQVAGRMANADVVLGIFGGMPWVQRAISNKVYMGLAMGRPVITARSPACEGFFKDREEIILCRPADPQDLAKSILALYSDEALRQRVGEQGYRRFQAEFTPASLGRKLCEVLTPL